MAEESTFLVKKRDYSDIAKLQDPGVLDEFLDQPATFIAETITGALATGTTGMMASGGRIVQAILKGRSFKQWGSEFKLLREKGRIPDGFAEKPYGFQTWVELMRIIDEECLDEDRLEALKAMFFAVNKIGLGDGERIGAYQLWQLAKSLSSGELVLLKVAYEHRDTLKVPQRPGVVGPTYSDWAVEIAKVAGHEITGLVDIHEKRLTELGLLTPRHPGWDTVSAERARLSDLGFRVCKNIEIYRIELQTIDSDAGQSEAN